MKENENQHEAIDQEMDDTFLWNYIRHTFACHLPYVHFDLGWALKARMQVSNHGITGYSHA